MAKDVDGDYYYDEGTVNEQMDEMGLYEKNGQVHVHHKSNDGLVKLDDALVILGAERGTPTTDELAEEEYALFLSDGSGDGTAGTAYLVHNDGGTIKHASLAAAADFSDLA